MTHSHAMSAASESPLRSRTALWQPRVAAVLMVLVLVFTTHSLHLLFADGIAEGPSGRPISRDNPAYQAFFMLLVVTVGVLLPSSLTLRRGLNALAAATAFLGLVTLSAIWSPNATTTLMNAATLAFQIGAAWVVSQWIGPRQFLRLTFATFATILVVSFVLFAIEPGLVGSDRWGGGWLTNQEFSGIMASKNYAGFVFAALYVMAFNGGAIGLGLPTRIFFAAAALVAVVLTNSATALVVVVIATVASVVLAFAGRLRWALVFLGLVATTAAVVLIPFISPGEGFDALGRDASFTGRADLWASAFKSIVEHPILGVGYNGFFDVGAFSPAWEMWSHFLYYFADNFHNSAVEMAVSLGVAGLAAFVAITLRACWIVFSDRCDGAVAVAAGLVLGVFIAGSAMEFAIMHHNFVATFLVFYFFFSASPQRG